jgi:hypothetical protein
VSRKTRERNLEAQERWPNLFQFLACYLHQDWPLEADTPEQAVDQAVANWNLEGRQRVLREWRDWNNVRGCRSDIAASLYDGFEINIYFPSDVEARQFMNMVYEKLITSVRSETAGRWTP